MWLILTSFLAVLLLSVLGGAIRVNSGNNQRVALVSPDTGLRAAATLALLAIIAVVLNIVKDTLSDSGFVTKLIAATSQSGGVSWPTALVISVLMVAMTIIVMGALWSIWGIVRQD